MKTGGYVYTSMPTINIPHGTPIHYNGFNPMGLVMIFKSVGFEIIEIGQWGNLDYIIKLFTNHRWPDASSSSRGCSHKNEEKNVSHLNHRLINTNPLDEKNVRKDKAHGPFRDAYFPVNDSLLLGDLPNYKLKADNTYTGEYSDNVNSYNDKNLIKVNPYKNKCSCINKCSCKNRGSCNIGNVISEGFTDSNSDISINSIMNNSINNVDNSESHNLVNSINNIINSENGVEINNEIPKNLLFTSSEQLNSAQSRSINNENREPVRSSENMLSAQGYGSNSGIVGFNEYGASAINYLCVDK